MIPRMLPNSIRTELGLNTDITAEDLVRRLEAKPCRLVSFLHAAFQTKNWCRKYEYLSAHIVCTLSSLVLKNVLPFEETVSQCERIYSLYLRVDEVRYISDFFVRGMGAEKAQLSKLILMRASPVLKRKFLENPGLLESSLGLFSPCLTSIGELLILYRLFYTKDYSELINLNTLSLQYIMHQCCDWQCSEHLEGIQRIMADRVQDYITASGQYALSAKRGLTLLQEKCRTFLEDARFLVHLSSQTHCDNYLLHDVVLDDENLKGLFSPHELCLMSGRLVSSGYEGPLRIRAERLCLTFQNETTLAVGRVKQPDLVSMAPIQRWRRNNREEKMDVSRVKAVEIDYSFKIPDISLIGMLMYFSAGENLHLSGYRHISEELLARLSEFTSLTCLTISDYQGALAELFPSFLDRKVKLTAVEVKEGGDFVELYFLNSTICFSSDFHTYNALKRIFFINVRVTGDMSLQTLLDACRHLECLILHEVNALIFKLPLTLKKLEVDAAYLNYYLKEESIPLLDACSHLKELCVVGEVDDCLSSILENYAKRGSFRVTLSKTCQYLS